jgi:SPP1 family predicted phage head-tail adaptor
MSAAMTAIGDLNRRLVLQEPVESADGEGGVSRTYQTVTTLWAQVLPLSAGADIAAASLGAALRYRIVVRARDDVTTRHRFVDGAHVYRVIAARLSADRRFLEIEAEERED